jgi:hypothetical protein
LQQIIIAPKMPRYREERGLMWGIMTTIDKGRLYRVATGSLLSEKDVETDDAAASFYGKAS